ncbi:UNVERIFIED_CONTAM: hypothetical protein RMT77_010596 [Armadillidium vulgare]
MLSYIRGVISNYFLRDYPKPKKLKLQTIEESTNIFRYKTAENEPDKKPKVELLAAKTTNKEENKNPIEKLENKENNNAKPLEEKKPSELQIPQRINEGKQSK